ncbi:amidohydrolase family protein [Thalassotalea sp. LPB0316]|uniref:amidohydrolase family protein n=1 Tax=Thalassotalea sp. LPB0316 TaxID=2769490 RepID=UPI0018664226|nr:amidohydrolase family protein [Thalassotalea sp. LPB0316]QOL25560.1 amidohydrolase family protein [Thalassotalea sp. LPB0316]
MKLFKSSLLALAVAATSTWANAESLAITNATVHTANEQGVLTNATILVEDGVITAINPSAANADKVIDAQGKNLTPGIISVMNNLGLVEVGAVSRSRDAGDKGASITFDPSLAYNPKSTVIAYTRKGGITSSVVSPRGGDSLFKGQTFYTDLSGEFDSIRVANNAVYVELGAESKGSRATNLQKLTDKLADFQAKLEKAKKDDKKGDELKRDEQVLKSLLDGEKLMVVYADRASELLNIIKLKQTFGLNLAIVSAADAVVVADELAKADVPVIIDAMQNLPSSFDALNNSLDNAAKLINAGVKVVITTGGDTHNMYQLRYNAGNAIANGLTPEQALAAITSTVAEVFGLDAGEIAVGKKADLVLWSADPFELSTKVEHIWIDGKEYSTQSRSDKLRDRYMATSDMPRAYTK